MQRPRLCRFLDRGVASANIVLLALDRFPQRIIDDAKVRHFIPDPFGFGIEPGDILAAARVFHHLLVVPDANADVQFVVDDAGASPHIAANARVAPCGAFRAGDAIGVEIARDGARTLAGRELAEDARSEEHTSELQSLMRISYAVLC